MTGYQETLTDPSYHRQVVVMTAPHIGNTGVNDEDAGVRPDLGQRLRRARPGAGGRRRGGRGAPSATSSPAQGVVGISGVDTRALTRHLRERGAMRVGVSSVETDPRALLERVLATRRRWRAPTSPARSRPPSRTSCRRIGREAVHRRRARPRHQGDDAARGWPSAASRCTCCRRPRRVGDVLATGADGVFLSNGPGDPATADHAVALTARACSAGGCRSSASASATRSSAGRSASAPTSCATATAASTSRCRTARPARSR